MQEEERGKRRTDLKNREQLRQNCANDRLRVASNVGDSGEIHAPARENGIPRGDAPREEGHPSGASAASPRGAFPRESPFLRARAGIDKIRDYRIYSIKRCPRINATLESKLNILINAALE